MKTIWKYQISITDEQTLSLPQHRKFLSLQLQNGIPCLWFLVDPDTDKESVIFDFFGTGQPINRFIGKFIGTVQLDNLVFHLFER
jgi:hypothetical protein